MNVPYSWTTVLHRLDKANAGAAVIAGGAVRDFLLGRSVRDIDVYITGGENEDEDGAVAQDFCADAVPLGEGLYDDVKVPWLSSVWDAGVVSAGIFDEVEVPVQLMFVKGKHWSGAPFPLLEKFDFGLCRALYDGESIYYTPDFVKDAFGLTITLIAPSPMNNSKQRGERLLRKYPDHTLVGV